MNTLTLNQAAGFLKMHPEEVRSRAKRGLIPASKPGRRWVFIDDDLAAFLRGNYATQRQALRVASEKGSAPWVSANEAPSGGSVSRHHQVSEYEEVLKRAARPTRRNSMID
jgi:Helix-turn-helix domain